MTARGPKSHTYDAFISYSHAADDRMAPAVQRALHKYAKRWNQLRALSVFRDQTGLVASPALWPAIQKALDGSRFFILFASPEAAVSPWVNKELEHWKASNGAENILVCLTDGELEWSDSLGDFDPQRSSALPPVLRGVFAQEPLYVDLRWARSETELSLRQTGFRNLIADLAAPIHGKAKEELESEDVVQYRRTRRVAGAGVTGLAVLAVTATILGLAAVRSAERAEQSAAEAQASENEAQISAQIAQENEEKAIRQADIALARSVAVQAELLEGQPDLSLLLHVAALTVDSDRFAANSLLRTLADNPLDSYMKVGRPPNILETGTVALRSDGKAMVAGGDNGRVVILDLETGERVAERAVVLRRNRLLMVFASEVEEFDVPIAVTSVEYTAGDVIVMTALTGEVIAWHESDWRIAGTGCAGIQQPLAATPTGDTVACSDGVTAVWVFGPDGTTSYDLADDMSIRDILLSDDGRLLVALWDDTSGSFLEFLDLETSTSRIVGLPGHGLVAALDPNEALAAVGMIDGSVALVNAVDATLVGQAAGHDVSVSQLAFASDSGSLFSGDTGGSLITWTLGPLTPVDRWAGHATAINALVSIDGQLVSTGFSTVAWSALGRSGLLDTRLSDSQAFDVAFLSESEFVHIAPTQPAQLSGLVGSDIPKVWNAEAPAGLVLAQDAERRMTVIGTVLETPEIVAFESSTGQFMWRAEVPDWSIGAGFDRGGIAVSADGSMVAAAVDTTTTGTSGIRLYDGVNGEELHRVTADLPVGHLSFHPSGALYASLAGSLAVLEAGATSLTVKVTPPQFDGRFAISRDGTQAALSGGGGVSIYSLPDFELLDLFSDPDDVSSLAFDNGGSVLAIGTSTGIVFLWDLAVGERIAVLGTKRPLDSVYGLDFGPSGQLVAATNSGPIVWDLRIDSMIQRACMAAGRGLTADEWAQYLGERPVEDICE